MLLTQTADPEDAADELSGWQRVPEEGKRLLIRRSKKKEKWMERGKKERQSRCPLLQTSRQDVRCSSQRASEFAKLTGTGMRKAHERRRRCHESVSDRRMKYVI